MNYSGQINCISVYDEKIGFENRAEESPGM
jgi:hypothetical protein